MSPEREKEFEELLAFLDFHHAIFTKPKLPPGMPVGLSLRGEVERIAREYGRSKALEGTRQAVNDVIEELTDLTAEGVELLDQALRDGGLQTLSEMRRRYSALYRKVVRRGKINSETEYYLVNGLVVDQGSALTSQERIVLQGMVSAYEG
jgi:hypothetical protein